MTNPNRIAADFLSPEPSFLSRLFHPLSKLVSAPEANIEGIDESVWNNSAGKKVDHKAAIAGGTRFFIIRVTNGLVKDTAFDTTWKSALDDGAKNVMLYANILGSAAGKDQAEFAMTSAQEFIANYPGKIVIWGDFEKDGLTISVPTRQTIALEFLNNIHLHNYETGIYSNVAYWGSLYGNLVPPPFAWLWGANWTPYTPTFPSSWNLVRLLVHQYAVWNDYTWSTPVAGNTPRLDNDRWKWTGGTPEDFLETNTPEPTPCPPCPELETNLSNLQTGYTALSGEFASVRNDADVLRTDVDKLLAQKPTSSFVPFITVKTKGRVIARFATGLNGAYKPKFEIYPGDTSDTSKRIYLDGKYKVSPAYIVGDSSVKAFEMIDPIVPNVTLYIRAEDLDV